MGGSLDCGRLVQFAVGASSDAVLPLGAQRVPSVSVPIARRSPSLCEQAPGCAEVPWRLTECAIGVPLV